MAQYYSERTPTGWTVNSLNPPLDPVPGLNATLFQGFSEDADTGIFSGPGTNVDDPTPGTSNVWRANADGTFDLITFDQPPVPPGGFPANPTFGGASDDASLVAFELATTPSIPVTAGPTGPDGISNAYAGNGTQLRLVSVLPNGTAEPNGGAIGTTFQSRYNAVSDDGSRIFWSSTFGSGPPEVYVRLNGTSTEHVSESQRTTPDPNGVQEKLYQYATPDGSFAFFTSNEKLTNNAQAEPAVPDLYRYDVDSGTLVDLTVGDPDGAGVLGVLGVSNSGSRVYFAATGALAPGATDGQPNLYVRDGGDDDVHHRPGHVDHLPQRLQQLVQLVRRQARPGHPERRAPDVRLDPRAARLSEQPVHGVLRLRPRERLVRVRLVPPGRRARDRERRAPRVSSGGLDLAGAPFSERRNLSTDGSTAFFVSPERLLNADTNGKYDVYMWDDGALDLVSTGLSSSNSGFGDASADGDDVFFLTREQLVGIDTDDEVDLYDARVGGGIAEQNPPPPPPPCQGDDCQGPPPVADRPGQPRQRGGDRHRAPGRRPRLQLLRAEGDQEGRQGQAKEAEGQAAQEEGRFEEEDQEGQAEVQAGQAGRQGSQAGRQRVPKRLMDAAKTTPMTAHTDAINTEATMSDRHPKRKTARLAGAIAIAALAFFALPSFASGALLQNFTAEVRDQNGDPFTQAGGHPFEAFTDINFRQHDTSPDPAGPDAGARRERAHRPGRPARGPGRQPPEHPAVHARSDQPGPGCVPRQHAGRRHDPQGRTGSRRRSRCGTWSLRPASRRSSRSSP